MIDLERLAYVKSLTNNDIAKAIEGHNAPEDQVEVQTTVTIPFYGDRITAILVDGEYMIPVKPIAERLGLDWEGQGQRIERDYILNSSACVIQVETISGVERSQTCLPVKYLSGWLFTIDDSRVKPEVQESLRRYKMEMYEVMHAYLVDGIALNPRMLKSTPKHLPSQVGEKEQCTTMNKLALSIVCEAADKLDNTYKIEFLSKAFRILNDIYPLVGPDQATPQDKQDLALMVMRAGYAPDIVRLSALCRLTETGARMMLQKLRQHAYIIPVDDAHFRKYELMGVTGKDEGGH